MKFIAYNPETKKKLILIEYVFMDMDNSEKTYYRDGNGNFVHLYSSDVIFQLENFEINLRVKIAGVVYYLIGEY